MKLQYVAFVEDHSGSMNGLAIQAMRDVNLQMDILRKSKEAGMAILADRVRIEGGEPILDRHIDLHRPALQYPTGGGTPLYEAVLVAIRSLQEKHDCGVCDASYLVMILTDGLQGHSNLKARRELQGLLSALQATDKWTFVFRGPAGLRPVVLALGLHEGNFQQWDQTPAGLEASTASTVTATQSYLARSAAGQGSTKSFYADLSHVKPKEVRADMTNISSEVEVFPNGLKVVEIEPFVLNYKKSYEKGKAFYQLVKNEHVQPQKLIAIQSIRSGAVYVGDAARDLLGLPRGERIKLCPKDNKEFEVFVQSTSTNRRIIPHQKVLYWDKLRSL
jgi:hypothetical protein